MVICSCVQMTIALIVRIVRTASGKLQTLSCMCFVLEAEVVHRGGPEVRLASLCNDPLIISLFLFKWRKRAFIILLTWEITAANAPLKSKTEPRF